MAGVLYNQPIWQIRHESDQCMADIETNRLQWHNHQRWCRIHCYGHSAILASATNGLKASVLPACTGPKIHLCTGPWGQRGRVPFLHNCPAQLMQSIRLYSTLNRQWQSFWPVSVPRRRYSVLPWAAAGANSRRRQRLWPGPGVAPPQDQQGASTCAMIGSRASWPRPAPVPAPRSANPSPSRRKESCPARSSPALCMAPPRRACSPAHR